MQPNWHRYLLAAILLVAAAPACAPRQPPEATGGVLDLSAWDFARDGAVNLDGEWELYWGRLLAPADFASGASPAPDALVRVPGFWTGYQAGGRPIPGQGAGTYRLRVLLPPAVPRLAISVRPIPTSYRLFADDRLAASSGRVGGSPGTARPRYEPHTAVVEPSGRTLTIVVQVSNFEFRAGGIRRRLQLGPVDVVEGADARRFALDAILVGTLIVMGAYHLGIHTLRHVEPSALWFALFSLAMAVKAAASGEMLLTRLWPAFPWALQVRLEYLANAAGLPLFYLFLAAIFPVEVTARARRSAQIAGGVLALVVFAAPVRVSSTVMPWYELLVGLFVVHAAAVFVLAARHHRQGAALLLAGGGVFLASVLHDLLVYRQILPLPQLMPLGVCVMILAQSGVLAQRLADAFRRQAALAQENARLVDELRARAEDVSRSRRLLVEREEGLRREIAEMLHGRVQTRLLVVSQWLGSAVELLVRHCQYGKPGAGVGGYLREDPDPSSAEWKSSTFGVLAVRDVR